MLAARVHSYGDVHSITVEEVDEPAVCGDAVLVDVLAVGLNAYDLLILRNQYQVAVPVPYIPGTEFVGVVREGAVENLFAPGDRVVGKMQTGALAERVTCPPASLHRAPEWMTIDQAASYRVAYETAIHAVRTVSSVSAGETVLVGGAAGGVGLAILDVAKALGLRAIAVCRPAQNGSCIAAGAWACVDRDSEDLVSEVRVLIPGGASVVFDPVGGEFSQKAVRTVRAGGTYVVLGFASGEIADLRLNRVLLNAICVTGFQNRTVRDTHPTRAEESLQQLERLVANRLISPNVADSYSLANVQEAFAALSKRVGVGKTVVRMPASNG